MTAPAISAWAAAGVGEITPGDDLCGLLHAAWHRAGTSVEDGDVVVVTSKVVSKAEGRVLTAPSHAGPPDRDAAVAAETDREVARRGDTRIVRTRHGFVMAAAGVDASNVAVGSLVLLPLDPDASAARLRADFAAAHGVRVAVVVSDTSGRAWRNGQTDIALGAAGLRVLDDHGGRHDRYGNPLLVTAPAVGDEVAGLAELATGKLSDSPAALVRGLDRFVLPADQADPGAHALIRAEESDMFGLGAREAALAALGATDSDAARRGYGAPATAAELRSALGRALVRLGVSEMATGEFPDGDGVWLRLEPAPTEFDAGRAATTFQVVAHAHGWRVSEITRDQVLASPRL